MHWLPALDVDGCPRRLPLFDRSAPALAAMVVDGASGETTAAAREALEVDPSLALWVLVRATQLDCAELRTTAGLADWLAHHARRVLCWSEGAELALAEPGWIERCNRLRRQSLAVASLAREFAGDGLADEAFLLGLVHEADEWWALDTATSTLSGRSWAPTWLVEALERLAHSSPDLSSPAAAVFEARQSIEQPTRPARDEQGLPTTCGEAAIAASLPKLAASLSRLEQLRDHFERQLETEKLEAMAEFAAGAGHEINNPLAVIAGRAQLLIADEANPERRRELAVMNSQAMRIFEMISDLMLFARPPRP
ncbi:MAG TPA: histidine kinase dimerization/phospho-acceptor domain-containing protein, partial [Pirellulales bacterium]|nr:histidine kinase dimerization/phospho-acceptor domain-containing protein [Pirellulales bacterium]